MIYRAGLLMDIRGGYSWQWVSIEKGWWSNYWGTHITYIVGGRWRC